MSQIRYHFKNEKLSSKRLSHIEEIELLQEKEKELLEKLKHTMERQEKIESETNSPTRIRRAPSLSTNAKLALFQSKLKADRTVKKNLESESENFGDMCNYQDLSRDEEAEHYFNSNREIQQEDEV